MIVELAILACLILLNGALAMSELAIVSARPGRLKVRGDRGSLQALRLAEDPGRFLSTVQIGITLVGVLSGAFSGATLGLRVSTALEGLGAPPALAQPFGVGSVVMVVTYLSLVIGELVPKQIALSNPEGIAARVAPAMVLLSKVAAPLVWILDKSGKLMLRILGQDRSRQHRVSDEEIHLLISEAESAGVIEKGETAMIEGVMRIADRTAKGLMTPRLEVAIADIDESLDDILERFRTSGRSRLPLRDGGPDDIIGILHSRDMLLADRATFDPRRLMMNAPVIHDALPAMEVVDRLRASPEHMLLVYDEYGHFEGIVTAMDILGAIAGGFDETEADEPKIVERDDGSLLVAGWMPIDEFADRLEIALPDDGDYETVAGLVLFLLGKLPTVGQSVQAQNWQIEVVDMDGRRIDKVLVQRTQTAPAARM
ncbi:Magnesium and cobalt efflux protein CorC [Roseivivax sp. THAF40]|uniref:hemolysin family protein n=1 Tax=unclassified Roseivivax TaxID=2639302 RepID=UPI001268CF83|nr:MULTISPECIES: hemolysin family protein [unclassified Roseivivax]QFS81855.1 Magnesium and cobalt efflux protein CorC [Roseivivax sp. THAF197b]QFT45655.1 Magnesium and cobalt efflux protein CorC [Roseivivax sp. THAF40]